MEHGNVGLGGRLLHVVVDGVETSSWLTVKLVTMRLRLRLRFRLLIDALLAPQPRK